MSTSKMSITLALALMVAGAAPAFAGASDDAMIRRLGPTESISPQASRVAPSQFSAQPFAGAYASAARAYPGGRTYHGTDPDARVRAGLERDCPNYRL